MSPMAGPEEPCIRAGGAMAGLEEPLAMAGPEEPPAGGAMAGPEEPPGQAGQWQGQRSHEGRRGNGRARGATRAGGAMAKLPLNFLLPTSSVRALWTKSVL